MAIDEFTLDTFKTELWQQCVFALMACEDMGTARQRRDEMRFWYAVQAFLVACANISKLCWSTTNRYKNEPEVDLNARIERGEHLRVLAGLRADSPLRPKKLRNYFEHFDERLDYWARTSPHHILINRCSGTGEQGKNFFIPNAGPSDMMGYFNIETNMVTFQDLTVKLTPMIEEVQRVGALVSPFTVPSSQKRQRRDE